MKTITVSELKAHLSKYLRLASKGERIVVQDRKDPLAELGPTTAKGVSVWDRLAREGKVKLGRQNWSALKLAPLRRRARFEDLLDEVQGD